MKGVCFLAVEQIQLLDLPDATILEASDAIVQVTLAGYGGIDILGVERFDTDARGRPVGSPGGGGFQGGVIVAAAFILYGLVFGADELRRRDPSVGVTVLGTATGLEARLVPERGYRLTEIPRVPLPRRPRRPQGRGCSRNTPTGVFTTPRPAATSPWPRSSAWCSRC